MHSKVALICLVLSLALASDSLAQEKKISKKDMPPAVLAAFAKAYPKATIEGMSSEVEEGKTFYEIESLDGKVKRDLLFRADGSIAEIEEALQPSELPAAVKAAFDAKHPKAKIIKAEKATRGSVVTYEVVSESGKVTSETVFDPAGKMVKESKSSKENEGKEAEEDEHEKD